MRWQRQIELLESGGKVVQETRLYDSDKDETRAMRTKEEANDYRYFPDPDLLPVVLEDGFVEELRKSLPELPDQKAARFVQQYGIPAYDARRADRQPRDGGLLSKKWPRPCRGEAKLAANWVMGDFSAALNKDGLEVSGQPAFFQAARRPAGAHGRQHHLRQAGQGSVRGDVGRWQRCRYRHRGARASSRSPTAAPSKS